MDINALTSLVGGLGFPIVCCIGLFWFLTKTMEQHKIETEKMREAITNNTNVMMELISKMRGE